MVVGHRLAPIGEGEIGVDALRLAKGLGGVGVLEAVEEQDAAHERRLGLACGAPELGNSIVPSADVCGPPASAVCAARDDADASATHAPQSADVTMRCLIVTSYL